MVNKPDASNRIFPGLLPWPACLALSTFYLHPSFLSFSMISLSSFKKLEIVPPHPLIIKKNWNVWSKVGLHTYPQNGSTTECPKRHSELNSGWALKGKLKDCFLESAFLRNLVKYIPTCHKKLLLPYLPTAHSQLPPEMASGDPTQASERL